MMQQMMVGLGIFVFNGATETYSTAGTYTETVPTGATSVTVKAWGAGGETTVGGTGGHVEGTISVSGGDTINVYVGAHDGGSSPSPVSIANGGGLSGVKYGSEVLIAGGGGGGGGVGGTVAGLGGGGNGPGQPGQGIGDFPGSSGTQSAGGSGGMGDPVAGGDGTSWNNGANLVNGGSGGGGLGGSDNRSAGGGAGYYGGGGGGGGGPPFSGNGSASGGGGGSGYISPNWTSTVSVQGVHGPASARDSGDSNYVSGRGGSDQDGLVVLIYT